MSPGDDVRMVEPRDVANRLGLDGADFLEALLAGALDAIYAVDDVGRTAVRPGDAPDDRVNPSG